MSDEQNDKSKLVQVIPSETVPVEEGYVVLPYNEGQFREFIKSLLGRPQTISKTIEGTFEIDQPDIRNLYHLILQRVTQQNEGVLAQFNAVITFSDNSVVQLNTIEEFLTYNEVRPLVPRTVHLKWDFLVRFRDKRVPEKQSIQISFVATSETGEEIDQWAVLRRIPSEGGFVEFRIEHTARTWGADIEALLSNHIQSLLKPTQGIRRFIRKHCGKIGGAAGIVFFTTAIAATYLAGQRFARLQSAEVNKLVQNVSTATIESLNAKLDNLAAFVASGPWNQFYLGTVIFVLVSGFLALLFGAWIGDSTRFARREPSFILFTKQAHKAKEEVLKRSGHQWLRFGFAIAVDIVVNIVANLMFVWFFG